MKRYIIILFTLICVLAFLASCGETATTPASTTAPVKTPATTAVSPSSTLPAVTETSQPPASTTATYSKDYLYASAMADFFYNINAVNNYYSEGLTSMSAFGGGEDAAVSTGIKVSLVSYTFGEAKDNIPPELLEKLPPDGKMAAPPGACPAAAEPYESFITAGGDVVTPELLLDKGVITLPSEMVNAPMNDPNSLYMLMRQMVPLNDMRLANSGGWDTLLWDKLRAMQAPAESLIDYQMWTLSDDLEAQVIAAFRQSLEAQGVPDMVLDAFDQSNSAGWYAQNPPSPSDALAMMDITATLTGSVSGVVHEWREFSIPSLGSDPVFGDQHGDGTVTIDIPEIGAVECTVVILFDQFDEKGRAVNGTVTATPVNSGDYEVIFDYKPDGSKEGRIIDIKTGEIIGYLTMTVDAEKFTNYVSVKEGTELKLPEDKPEFTHFQ